MQGVLLWDVIEGTDCDKLNGVYRRPDQHCSRVNS